jgi:hypothetical protein
VGIVVDNTGNCVDDVDDNDDTIENYDKGGDERMWSQLLLFSGGDIRMLNFQ